MEEYVLRTEGLTKIYAGAAANDNIDMHIKRGDIYGFIGNNGAGKTTLIKIVAGLVSPARGRIELFSQSTKDGLSMMRRRIGCIIETPALYPDMTAAENLEYRRKLLGIPDKGSVASALKTVSLQDTGKKKAKRFSLGMKQRLGIAIALMGNPDFLVLDEPVNGLDPKGIIELRELLLRLNRENGITILISSHILSELSKLVTCYGIISKGRLIQEISAGKLEERCRKYLKIRVDDFKKACFILETSFSSSAYDVQPDNSIRLYEMIDKAGNVTAEFLKNGIGIEEVAVEGQDLETYFMSLMGGVAIA